MPDMKTILFLLVVAALAFWALQKKFDEMDGPLDTFRTSP